MAPVAPLLVRMADLDWSVSPQFASTAEFLGAYLADGPRGDDVAGRVAPDASDIAFERAKSAEGTRYSDGYLETLAVLRAVAERAPRFGCVLMHGALIEHRGRGYLLCAPSGTGKSTHARLWCEVLGDDVRIVNGDKPFVRVYDTGEARAFGSPWMGKEGWGRNASVPLAGICFLERAGDLDPSAAPVSSSDALPLVAASTYFPSDPAARLDVLDVLDALMRTVFICTARVAMDERSVRVVREVLTAGLRT